MRHTPEDLAEVFERLGLAREFEPQAWIGEGGSAQVFRAVHRVTGHVVALKVWDRLSQVQRRRFLREVEVMQQATSGRRDDETCLVDLLWAAEAHGAVYPVAWVAMGLYECSLADRLTTAPPLTGVEAAQICADLLTGLATLHQAGILHRDVKPANVLLRDGRAVITDFGLAARTAEEMTLLNAGTPGYLAPELDGPQPSEPTVRSDLYAAGKTIEAVFSTAVTAPAVTAPAVTAPAATAEGGATTGDDGPERGATGRTRGGASRTRPSKAPHGIRAVIARATDPDPGQRFDTAQQMRTALGEAWTATPTRRGRLFSVLRRPAFAPADLRRGVSLPMVAALLAAIGLGAAIMVPMGGKQPPATGTFHLVSGGTSVRMKECSYGDATVPHGLALLLGARNIDSVDGAWTAVRVNPLPPAGVKGPWQAELFFGLGESAIGQLFEVKLVAVPASEIPIDAASAQVAPLMDGATRLADNQYRRASGAGLECDN